MQFWVWWWHHVWGWLAKENQALSGLTALATVAGVIVAAIYAGLTWLLARQATRQAQITRLMFDATYRPWVSVDFQEDNFFANDSFYRFDIVVQTYGQVPGFLIGYRLTVLENEQVSMTDASDPSWIRPLYPGNQKTLTIEKTPPTRPIVMPVPGSLPVVTVEFVLRYKGSSDRIYKTEFTMTGRYRDWRNTRFNTSEGVLV